jgi:hypothetical protein
LFTVDAYNFSAIPNSISNIELTGIQELTEKHNIELKPHFHEWATVQPGMICVARKKKTAIFRNYIAAETAVPVIVCAACMKKEDEKEYFFAGVARSKSVRSPDDGAGPNVDEFFTVSIGGMATILNTSGDNIHPGDLVEWCFFGTKATSVKTRPQKGPRRIGISVASVSSPRVIGRALSVTKPFSKAHPNTPILNCLLFFCAQFSKNGETFDILIRQ